MTLDLVLTALRTLHDLPRLAAALGYQPLWEEIPVETIVTGPALQQVRLVAVIGRSPGFRWVGLEADQPSRLARSVAGRLAGRGELAGVMALNPVARRLALALALDEPALLEIDLEHPGRVGLASLARIAGIRERAPLALAARIAESLSGEGLGHRFFITFQSFVDRMAQGMPAQAAAGDRRQLALLQLTRVLFLYFVQCKGWLDGREDFLPRQVDHCLARGRQIHRDLLRPLFFGTLNRPDQQRGRSARFGRIPFLNGGLFEPQPLERRWRKDIPNHLWRAAFDELFERFHFTLDESGATGAIAPDMLGRVFEGLMAPEARRSSGTFYTPARLVRELVDAGLTAVVASYLRCGDDRAWGLVVARDPQATRILDELTLLDPAVGSGAFLLGALERLAGLRSTGRPDAALKREILRRNLFGVDLNPTAVRLTELRLWLAIIADDPAPGPEAVAPLPNLDCLVRQGDSLMDPLGMVGGLPLNRRSAGLLLTELRRRLVTASGEDKPEQARRLRRAEVAAMQECLTFAEERLDLEVAECLGEARAPTLFGGRRGLDSHLRARLELLRSRLRLVRRSRHRLTREGELPWFQYQSHFGDVFAARGGFDLVIGNPPWVRAEHLSPALRRQLSARYRWWRMGGRAGFAHQPDLSIAFVERGLELLAPGGTLAFLVPSKIATAGYALSARRALAGDTTLHVLADLADESDGYFEATTYPLALVASKNPPPPRQAVRSVLPVGEPPGIPQSSLLGGSPWILVRRPLRVALAALHGEHPRLAERFVPQLGVKTGANAIFLNPDSPVEPVLLRRAIRGRDIRPFQAEGRVTLIWTHDRKGRVFPRLPPLAAKYFQPHLGALVRRADYVAGPPWMLFRTGVGIAGHRVIWADIGRRLAAAALVGDAGNPLIPLNTCYVIVAGSPEQAEALTAWLNSTWIRAAARSVADPARGGFARYNARTIAALPLPPGVLGDRALVSLARAAALHPPNQQELDDLCAQHLDLSPASRAALADMPGVRPHDRC